MRRFTILLASVVLIFIGIGIFYLAKYIYPIPRAVSTQQAEIVPTQAPIPTSTEIPVPTLSPTPTLAPTPTPKPTPVPLSEPPGSGYSTRVVETPKGNFSAQILSLNLSTTRVITDTANDSDCAADCPTMSLSDFVAKNGGFAAVNGTYFCPNTYPECSSKTNSFDFPVYNSRLNHWINAGNLSWNERRAIFYVDGSGAHYQNNSSGFSGGLSAGIINYPGLLDGGNVQIDDNQSGLSDKQKAKGTKVGIGLIDQNTVLVVIAAGVNMQEFAYVFKSLGASGALNLDTGGSTALYHSGRYLAGPGRLLPNAIIFASK